MVEQSINTKLQDMEVHISEVEKRIISLEHQIISVDLKMTQVIDAILGNPLTKTGGFIEEVCILKDKIRLLETRIEEQDKKIAKQEEFKHKLIWTGTIIITIGIVIDWLATVYSNLIKK